MKTLLAYLGIRILANMELDLEEKLAFELDCRPPGSCHDTRTAAVIRRRLAATRAEFKRRGIETGKDE